MEKINLPGYAMTSRKITIKDGFKIMVETNERKSNVRVIKGVFEGDHDQESWEASLGASFGGSVIIDNFNFTAEVKCG